MKNIFLSALFCLSCVFAYSQKSLELYLANHMYPLTLKDDGQILFSNEMKQSIHSKMKGKRLFIFGEGGSHFLELNHLLLVELKKYFILNNVKYVFIEADPAYAVAVNSFIRGDYRNSELPFLPEYKLAFDEERDLYNAGHYFERVGIDFTRPSSFRLEMNNIKNHLDSATVNKIAVIAPYIEDTTYMTYHIKQFVKFYKDIRTDFYRDSSKLKPLLAHQYEDFKTLLTNVNTATPVDDRDHPMAENLINKISADADTDTYFLDCGGYHSRPNQKGRLANILSRNELLSGKMVVMNVFCENCITKVEAVSNWTLPFMKKDVLQAFENAAKKDIVVFDLSELPADFNYIKEYGDYLVFARNQK